MPVVADTSFLIDVRRQERGALALLDRLEDEREVPLVPSVVLAEFLAGFEDAQSEFARLDGAVEILSFTPEDALEAGRLWRAAARAGRFPGFTDVCVAAFARRRGASVATADRRHFPDVETIGYRAR